MLIFDILSKDKLDKVLPSLFRILHSNMSVIAPTGNDFEKDYRIWIDAVSHGLKQGARKIILLYDDAEIIGYFQYYVNSSTFMMEEIQFKKEYQGTGIFRLLYSYLFEIIPQETLYVEAYAHKQNSKSQNILKHLGLQIVVESTNGNSYHFRGDCRNVLKRYDAREHSIQTLTQRIITILSDSSPSIYLYGSIPLGDFRLGWSDIDILVLTDKQITEEQAQKLVGLRQAMLEREPGTPYYRSFEGGMLTLDAFLTGKADRVVYWGTSGERITDTYMFDSFGMTELIESSVLLYGNDIRNQLKAPEFSELYADVKYHYETIRKYVQKTGRSFYSFGWMLDIARCIYTLRTGKIIAKTDAADWALENNLCPDPDALRIALEVRRSPLEHEEDKQTFDYAETLAAPIQRFADVLEKELYI
ncbi:MAG: GNAT family N-acetyltransferase, partial [Hydrogeniiclostridium mannosilyticum]